MGALCVYVCGIHIIVISSVTQQQEFHFQEQHMCVPMELHCLLPAPSAVSQMCKHRELCCRSVQRLCRQVQPCSSWAGFRSPAQHSHCSAGWMDRLAGAHSLHACAKSGFKGRVPCYRSHHPVLMASRCLSGTLAILGITLPPNIIWHCKRF